MCSCKQRRRKKGGGLETVICSFAAISFVNKFPQRILLGRGQRDWKVGCHIRPAAALRFVPWVSVVRASWKRRGKIYAPMLACTTVQLTLPPSFSMAYPSHHLSRHLSHSITSCITLSITYAHVPTQPTTGTYVGITFGTIGVVQLVINLATPIIAKALLPPGLTTYHVIFAIFGSLSVGFSLLLAMRLCVKGIPPTPPLPRDRNGGAKVDSPARDAEASVQAPE